jgi:Tol biopolymer transport system component
MKRVPLFVLVFLSLQLLFLAACSSEEASAPSAIYVANSDGSERTAVFSAEDRNYWGAAWSPDGTMLAFSSGAAGPGRSEDHDLFLADPEGGEPVQLTDNSRNNYLPAWSPDGSMIAFISQEGDDTATSEIYLINVDGTGEKRLTDNDAWEHGAAWSPDGTKIAFGSELGGAWQIYTMNPDGSDMAPLPVPAHGRSPAWSPDGSRIAFNSDKDGGNDIWVMNADGSDQRNLTAGNGLWDDNPQWTADGERLVFAAWPEESEGTADVYVMNADGSNVEPLVFDPKLDSGIPSWSPDDKRIVFHAIQVGEEE